MNANDLMVQHGEKVAIAVIAVICGYVIYGTLTNPDIHPSPRANGDPVTSEQIKATTSEVLRVTNTAKPPNLKDPPGYLADMRKKFATVIQPSEYMVMTTGHPDAGPADTGESAFVYVYELRKPQLEIRDTVGTFELKVIVPESKHGGLAQLSDEAQPPPWIRKQGNANIENRAGIIGAFIEIKEGKGDWSPLNEGKVSNGFVELDALGEGLLVKKLNAWKSYSFRARLAAKATGYTPFGQVSPPDQAVLVSDGEFDANPDKINWTQLSHQVRDNDKAVTAKLIPGDREGPPDVTQALGDKELLYRSDWSDVAEMTASSAVRMYLDKVSAADPNNPLAVMQLTKLMYDNENKGVWLHDTVEFKVPLTEKVGGEKAVDIPTDEPATDKIIIDLSTPYKLLRIEKVKRVFFWEVKIKSRDGAKGKVLEIEPYPKDREFDSAVFTNTENNEKKTYLKLEQINRPNRSGDVYIYPDYPAGGYKEEDVFKADPGAFIQPRPEPAKPRMWDANTGPLEELRKQGNVLATTDTPYVQMPDGRLIYYEPTNNRVRELKTDPATFVPEPGAVDPKGDPKPDSSSLSPAETRPEAKPEGKTEGKTEAKP